MILLVSPDTDFQTERSIAALVRPSAGSDGPIAQVHRIGRGYRLRTSFDAVRMLRRLAPQTVIHAWGLPALTAAALASSRGTILFSPVGFPSDRQIGWLRAIFAYRDVHCICPTATIRSALLRRGVPIERVHLIRPGVDFSRVKRRRDAELRSRLGLQDEDIAVLAAGESTPAAAHDRGMWAMSMLRLIDPRYRFILWGRGPTTAKLARFANRVSTETAAAVACQRIGNAVQFEDLMTVADVVLVTAKAPVPTLPIATAMAAGLPIVSTVSYTVAELLEDRHNALMVTDPSPRLIAQRVLDLRDQPSLQWQISDTARTEAYEFFSLSRFLHQHRTVYQQVENNQPVEVPEVAPGAGSRFSGRA